MKPQKNPKFLRHLKLQIPDATATAVPNEGVEEAGIPITQIVDGGENADKDSDSEDNIPIRFCFKRRVEEPSADIPKTPQNQAFEGSHK